MRNLELLSADIYIFLGLILSIVIFVSFWSAGYNFDISIVAAVASMCVIWWITEPIPIPITSLVPLAIFPLTGVLTSAEVAGAYGSPLILLLLGGFLLSKAMEHSGAHRRLALAMIRLFGAKSLRGLVMGFMFAAAFLSMWISNTATALMLLPVALAILSGATDPSRVGPPLLLGLAYACSVGGIGTPIGTPPNLVFMQVYEQHVGETVSFVKWMSWGLPVVFILIPLIAISLTRGKGMPLSLNLPKVGNWSSWEKRVMTIFFLTALAWITRTEPLGGWSLWLSIPEANDASVAFLCVILMFIVPNGEGGRLLDWERASDIPWGVLLLFAGGMCLAKAFEVSGLSEIVGNMVVSFLDLPLWLLIVIICLGVTFMTETTSNTASTALLMPILASVAITAGLPLESIMVPAAMTASCAFMLPVATAPNSIVFGSGMITSARMAREGLVLNLTGVIVVSTVSYFLLT